MSERFRKVADGVYYANGGVVRVGDAEIRFLEERVADTQRGRIRLCAHSDEADALHEMLILVSERSYIRPHRHRAKSESHHVVRGLADVLFFDNHGGLVSVERYGPPGSGHPFFYRIAEPVWHTLLIRSETFVLHETTNGPLRREDTQLAPWAPDENDGGGVMQYRRALEKAIRDVGTGRK